MLRIDDRLAIPDDEIHMSAVRSRGAGGQNVNKVATAIHLRFDIRASSLPDAVRQRLLDSRDSRITTDGVLVIKAMNHRSQDKNRSEALERLRQAVAAAAKGPRVRIATRPTRASKQRRLEDKKHRAAIKRSRSRPLSD